MKKMDVIVCAVGLFLFLFTAPFLFAQTQEDIQKYSSCKYCNMNREIFNYSRMLIEYSNGTRVGLCSLHCAALDLALNPGNQIKAINVADYNTKQLIDARKAIWVMGGKKQGVMTSRAKWAFGTKAAAEAFIKENGGTRVDFDRVMKAIYEDMYQDVKMISGKKAKASGSDHMDHDRHHHE